MIYLIITTSLHDKVNGYNSTDRENRYIDCIQSVLTLVENDSSVKPIIVENNGLRPTRLDELKCDVVYTNNNSLHFKHKGVNELLDMKQVIKQYNIQDEDVVIKLTGRYKLLDTAFINLIKGNLNTYDAFIKFFEVCSRQYGFYDCVLGLFAIKCKFLNAFEYKCEVSAERDFATYVRTSIERIMEVPHLNLECCFADDLRILYI